MQDLQKLLDRYFSADTTVAEERRLRELLSDANLPEEYVPYREMFGVLSELKPAEAPYRARRLSWRDRLYPLMRAAACVACVLCVVMAADEGMRLPSENDIVAPTNTQAVGSGMSSAVSPSEVQPGLNEADSITVAEPQLMKQ